MPAPPRRRCPRPPPSRAFFVHPAAAGSVTTAVQAIAPAPWSAGRTRLHARRPSPGCTAYGTASPSTTPWPAGTATGATSVPATVAGDVAGHADPKWTYWYLAASPRNCSALASDGLKPPGEPTMTALAPTLQAFFTQPADRPAPGQPAYGRRLPRRVAAPAALRRGHQSGSSQPSSDFEDLDATTIAAFPDPPGARSRRQRHHPQRPAGRAVRSLFTFAAAAIPSMRRSSPGCWPSPPNEDRAVWSPSSTLPRSRPC